VTGAFLRHRSLGRFDVVLNWVEELKNRVPVE
jgi:hypothetical protein